MAETNEILYKTGKKMEEILEQIRRSTISTTHNVQSWYDPRLGAFIAGSVMCIISGMLLVMCSLTFIYLTAVTLMGYSWDYKRRYDEDHPYDFDEVYDIIIRNSTLTVCLIYLVSEFTFSVVLADGAAKGKSGHLKAYYIYGYIKSVLAFFSGIALYVTMWDRVYGNTALVACGVNAALTVIAGAAYKDSIGGTSKDHKIIEDEVPIQEKV